ncbi:hypothetical protein K525DRAFT_274053 [Schizophyllum commune Loenen D]|nr:hypothetical protein K525DRAFT_274053 [Schizophyllum commune Loenen D]
MSQRRYAHPARKIPQATRPLRPMALGRFIPLVDYAERPTNRDEYPVAWEEPPLIEPCAPQDVSSRVDTAIERGSSYGLPSADMLMRDPLAAALAYIGGALGPAKLVYFPLRMRVRSPTCAFQKTIVSAVPVAFLCAALSTYPYNRAPTPPETLYQAVMAAH